ncbi:MAG: RNA polymerase sigma factor (sigma-70 family) [Cyclobacteriaceae bacterium]
MTSTTLNIHADLISRCRENDSQAQFEIYKLYAKAMLNTAFRIVGSVEEAEDVLQESFVSAFKNLHTYREEAAFGSWLKRIVVNRALTELKRRKNEILILESGEDVAEEPPKDYSEIHLSIDKIKEAMMDLPKGFRSVLTLYLFEGYDHKEISDILNITESTSKTQYKRAKDKLREILKSEIKYG